MAKYDKVIPPGQSGKIIGELRTRNYQGNIKKSFWVSSNDPNYKRAKLYLQCSILGVKILPFNRAYFHTGLGKSETKELTIATIGEGPLSVSTESSNPEFVIRLEKLTNETKPSLASELWKQYKLLITIPETFPLGRFYGNITLKTSSKYNPSIRISVTGSVNPNLVVSPTSVSMRSNENGQIAPRIISVTQRYGTGLMITKVTTEPPQLKAEIKQTKKGKKYNIKLTWVDQKSKGKHDGKIVIHTNDSRTPILTVPATLIVK